MRIAVVEDNMENRAQLLQDLHQYLEKTAIRATIDTFEKGRDFLETMRMKTFDMVFLDVFLEPEVSGMDVAYRIREKDQDCKIVFTTVSESFAVESYQVRAFDYLVKPYQYERLQWTIICGKVDRTHQHRFFVYFTCSGVISGHSETD